MKRIYSIFLCAVILTALFIVPFSASAEEENLVGTWLFNDKISTTGLTSSWAQYSVNFVANGVQYDSLWISLNYTDKSKVDMLYRKSNDDNSVVWALKADVWSEGYQYITILEEPDYESLTTLIKSNAEKVILECDGSCAVPDENLDGICEDCGFPFSLRNTGYEYNHSVTFNTVNGVIRADYMSNEPFTIRGYKYGSSYRVEPSIDVYCMTYLNDELTYQGLVAMHYPSYNLDDTVVSSTFDWYTSNDSGEIFFPLPLWVMVEKVTQGEMIPFSNQTVGNLMTLTLCGVGLITLLVALYLLLRMLRTYLPR